MEAARQVSAHCFSSVTLVVSALIMVVNSKLGADPMAGIGSGDQGE